MSHREAPRPVVVLPARGAPRPLIVEVPHAGLGVPGAQQDSLLLDEDERRRDADLEVHRLYGRAPELGVTLIYSEISRFVVDLNRADDDVDDRTVTGLPTPRPDAPRGLIWRLTTRGTPTMAAPLTRAQYERRVELYHAPYHRALDAAVEELRRRYPQVIVLSGHSMPSVGKATHADPGRRRADVVPGDRRATTCDPAVTAAAVGHFESHGLRVAVNDPYLGGETTRRLGRPSDGLHALQVELNRDLYLEEESGALKAGGFAWLAALCDGLVDRLADLAPALGRGRWAGDS